jgi:hypothetical protein
VSESTLPLRLAIKSYKDIVTKGTSAASESQATVFVAERNEYGISHRNIRISHRPGIMDIAIWTAS